MRLGLAWKAIPGIRAGDWTSRLLTISQVLVGLTALVAFLGILTREPLLFLAFSVTQGLMVVGIVLFAVVGITAQRTMVLETFEPGDTVFREGEPGRHVYVVKSGTLEVFRQGTDGATETLKRLGPSDPFGEMALLRRAPRNASIRALTAAEVYKMSPGHFAALYTNLPGIREHFNRLIESRLRELESRK